MGNNDYFNSEHSYCYSHVTFQCLLMSEIIVSIIDIYTLTFFKNQNYFASYYDIRNIGCY